mgnify:CR=1 FL=1|tara:strand:+ start:684 stop:1082 length:399 start_codon:yes stop_codon:yes gene_type:complete
MSWESVLKINAEPKVSSTLMKKIVNDLELPKEYGDGGKITYTIDPYYGDFDMVPSLKSIGNEKYELEIKVEGELQVWDYNVDAQKAIHVFTEKDIVIEDVTIKAEIGKSFELGFDYLDYNNGKIYLEVYAQE